MGRSEAESIYQAWNTRDARRAVTPDARGTGAFDNFRKQGFDILVSRLVAYKRTKGDRRTAEQAWKLVEKFERRHDQTLAREVLKALQSNPGLAAALMQYPSHLFTALYDEAQTLADRFDPNNIYFPKAGKRVRILRMLGKGGAGGAVYLGEDAAHQQYAVKKFVRKTYQVTGHGGARPRDVLDRTQHYLMRYFEAALTTTCLDAVTHGLDDYVLLQLGEGGVDYTKLNLSDIQSVFEDLQKVYDYSKHYMTVHVTQDVSVLHMDIHGENLMRFGGKLRLIDFGFALIFSPGQEEQLKAHTPARYDANNPDLYIDYNEALADKKNLHDPTRGSWKKYIDDWQQAYREAPEVQLCQSCSRQYPLGMAVPACMRCGSRKIVSSRLRRADIEGTARLKGVSPGTIGTNPYAGRTVASVDMQQYGCIVLTAVLIKEIWVAAESGRDLGLGGKRARDVVNVNVYSLARNNFHRFQGEAQAGVVQLLLLWFDEMMRRLFEGEKFTARDALAFFGGGTRGVQPSRERRHSVSF
jgi:serine/threonine protein kinase